MPGYISIEDFIRKEGNRHLSTVSLCTHFGGQLDYKDGKFVCQWHGAEFAREDDVLYYVGGE